jgi:hypothetical protein
VWNYQQITKTLRTLSNEIQALGAFAKTDHANNEQRNYNNEGGK